MQPYQRATEEIIRQGEMPKKIAQRAGSSALAAAGIASAGKPLAQKAMALINKFVPSGLAIKGLEKLDPRFKKFIDKALSYGKSEDEILDFIGQKAEEGMGQEPEQEKPKENRNIIEQYSPELHQFILDEMQGGRSPIEAGAIASLDRKGQKSFKKIIEKITNDYKTPWSAILQSVYGVGQSQQKTTNQPEQQQQQQGNEKWTNIANELKNLLNM